MQFCRPYFQISSGSVCRAPIVFKFWHTAFSIILHVSRGQENWILKKRFFHSTLLVTLNFHTTPLWGLCEYDPNSYVRDSWVCSLCCDFSVSKAPHKAPLISHYVYWHSSSLSSRLNLYLLKFFIWYFFLLSVNPISFLTELWSFLLFSLFQPVWLLQNVYYFFQNPCTFFFPLLCHSTSLYFLSLPYVFISKFIFLPTLFSSSLLYTFLPHSCTPSPTLYHRKISRYKQRTSTRAPSTWRKPEKTMIPNICDLSMLGIIVFSGFKQRAL